ncbi:hypothetical protein LCGC14_3056590 [marine sediment metagenome]|uniref:Uncharacterized protein n=1 Tax=marine sediment metagenome TaxID=412755 RepID=A0A0F8ZAX2_9ZZZZ
MGSSTEVTSVPTTPKALDPAVGTAVETQQQLLPQQANLLQMIGQQIMGEQTNSEQGVRFKKVNPQYQNQQPAQAPQQAAQGKRPDPARDLAIKRGNALNAVMSAMTISNVEMEGYLRAGYEWCKNGVWVLGTRQSQGGQPNPQYVGDNPPPPVEDDIPF